MIDANVLVAAMNQRDKHHTRMRDLLNSRSDPFVVTPYVVTYLLQKFAGARAEIQFMETVGDGHYRQEGITPQDTQRIVELMRQFRDFPLGAADASVIAVAERLRIREIATIDDHFRAVRPRGIDYFTLPPWVPCVPITSSVQVTPDQGLRGR
ncbi:PIN domain-containing protein [Streptomyces mirabilis]|uniref:type II toxin-antitoxin system VapC family toxin n=1 Tax=Streptomyces mirabilis TaxID=68239 RepID=UPI001BAF40D5|nr:PIN domain-containing protein [Streptomyces mirabilis]QUW83470.1 PIN domain-containing protein [Streptomyces mirabilis]